MALTSRQSLRVFGLGLPRSVLWFAMGGSVAVHVGFLVAVFVFRWDPFVPRGPVTDVPTETVLTLTPPAPVVVKAVPMPVLPPPPPPVVEAQPEPIAVVADAMPTPEVAPPAAPLKVESPQVPSGPQLPTATAPIVPVHEAVEPSEPMPVSFAGDDGARAKRVVYVVDASGAMASSLRFIKEELIKSLASLDPSQTFQIVVVRDPPGSPSKAQVDQFNGGTELLKANTETRIRVAAWLEGVQPGGSSDPLAGLTAAMKFNPDAVFLLTHSIRRSGSSTEWGAGNAATLATIDHLNPADALGRRPATIKAIQFLYEDPTGLLQEVGRLHGSYRVLKIDTLR